MSNSEKRLAEMGIVLPSISRPQGRYLPYVLTGDLVFIAGQGPREDGELVYKGIVGAELDLTDARAAARLCALNILANLRAACDGDLDRVVRMVRVVGLVRCSADFEQQAMVLNAASDLICDVLGPAGPHARIASGTHAFPNASKSSDRVGCLKCIESGRSLRRAQMSVDIFPFRLIVQSILI